MKRLGFVVWMAWVTAGIPAFAGAAQTIHEFGFSISKNQRPQFKDPFTQVIQKQTETGPSKGESLKDLPLVEVSAAGDSSYLAVFLSGDGGWVELDREVSAVIANRGIPVVGLNSLRYFWTARTPETAARDLERILGCYLSAWSKQKAVLIGYSFGADVLPFMAVRLPAALLARVALIALLEPSSEADFEFHVTDWANMTSPKALPVMPEVQKLNAKSLLCVYGEQGNGSLCRELHGGRIKRIALKGSHHFDGDYKAVADTILKEVDLRRSSDPGAGAQGSGSPEAAQDPHDVVPGQ